MNIDQPLYWHQGLFLQPQHLQHNDRLNAHRVARLAQVSMPHSWGIVSLQVAEGALATGQFTVDQLSVLFRDGTLAEFPGNALLESRMFVPGELSNGPRTVYVGLRKVMQGQPNAGMYETLDAAARAQTRFATLAEPAGAPDYLCGNRIAEVRPMHYVLRLFWDHELADLANYEVVAMARIEQDGDVTRLSPRFVPPCANIGASSVLTQMLRDVRDELIGRAHQLEVYKHAADSVQTEWDPGQMRLLMALAVLNRFGPLLSHFLETPQAHPWDVYGLLRQLVGELSWFSMRCDMLGRAPDGQILVPAYRHDDLGPQLGAVATLIGQMMNEITFGPEQVVRFTETSAGWLAELPDSFLAPRNRYYLVVAGAADVGQIGAALPRDAKLGAPNEVDDFVNRSLPGVELLYLQVPPPGMPRRSGAVYFRIEQMSEAWMSVTRSRAAVLFFPDAPKQFIAELVAVTR